jgi:hypothetical protein
LLVGALLGHGMLGGMQKSPADALSWYHMRAEPPAPWHIQRRRQDGSEPYVHAMPLASSQLAFAVGSVFGHDGTVLLLVGD